VVRGGAQRVDRRSFRYSYIVASHVIEHTTDLLGFLVESEKRPRPEGVLVLTVPDKRFAFDVLRHARASVTYCRPTSSGSRRMSPARFSMRLRTTCYGQDSSPGHVPPTVSFASSRRCNPQKLPSRRDWHRTPSWTSIGSLRRRPFVWSPLTSTLVGSWRYARGLFSKAMRRNFTLSCRRGERGCPVDRLTLLEHAVAEEAGIATRSNPPSPDDVATHLAVIAALAAKLAVAER
jgi:hypothetical protein